MVIDSSAIAAILLNETEAATFEQLIADDPIRLMSAGTLIETGMIIESKLGAVGGRPVLAQFPRGIERDIVIEQPRP